ncbi:hypothetical protein BD769DRAFT_1677624 [Suillus cothurnatus]|nr:hypothetical protein BD769DRAFT_1677624 [Suillus cothurnatus]
MTQHTYGPAFLYKDEQYDPQNPTNGLFKGHLLLKTFKYIFTSPTSAEMEDQEEPSPNNISTQGHPKHRTRCDVAGLLNMKSVQPRAIAYVAVQLRFALSSTGSWRVVDDEFNNQEFYDNIIDFLKLPITPDASKEVDNLLLWWNREAGERLAHIATQPSPLGAALKSARNMATLREIELWLKSVKNIEKITKSMRMSASTKLAKAQCAMQSGKQYDLANSSYHGISIVYSKFISAVSYEPDIVEVVGENALKESEFRLNPGQTHPLTLFQNPGETSVPSAFSFGSAQIAASTLTIISVQWCLLEPMDLK